MQFSPELYHRALYYAANAHGKQEYPCYGFSYMVHVSHVTIELFSALADCSQEVSCANADLAVQCALLHDVIEDTFVTYEDLEQYFGKAVADGVLALSKNPKLPKENQMLDSIERILKQPKEIWMVKLADRVANLYPPPPERTNEQNKKYYEEAIILLNKLGSSSEFLSKRLDERIKNYKQYIV